MPLIVEDRTGKPDANSYASVAQAEAYHTARNNAAWTGSTKRAAELLAVEAHNV
jgi:hypothetical protein